MPQNEKRKYWKAVKKHNKRCFKREGQWRRQNKSHVQLVFTDVC